MTMLYEDDEKTGKRPCSPKKLLRCTFPDGTVICYKNATMTFVETLRKIGVDKLQTVELNVCKLPIFTREIYKGYEQYMKPLDDGWYVFAMGDSSEKLLRLNLIIQQLDLDIKVEMGSDFEPAKIKGFAKGRKKVGGLLIQFADGEFVGGESTKDSYIQAIQKIGVDTISYRGFEERGEELVTRYNKYKGQVQCGDKWITIPGLTKSKVHALETISQKLNLGLKITVID